MLPLKPPLAAESAGVHSPDDYPSEASWITGIGKTHRGSGTTHKQYVDPADAYGIPALVHTCGSSSWAYEDVIEMGIRGVDALQPGTYADGPVRAASRRLK